MSIDIVRGIQNIHLNQYFWFTERNLFADVELKGDFNFVVVGLLQMFLLAFLS